MTANVLVVRIKREEKRNAIVDATAEGLSAVFDLLDDDPEMWVGPRRDGTAHRGRV